MLYATLPLGRKASVKICPLLRRLNTPTPTAKTYLVKKDYLSLSYQALGNMASILLRCYGTSRMIGFTQDAHHMTKQLRLGKYQISLDFTIPLRITMLFCLPQGSSCKSMKTDSFLSAMVIEPPWKQQMPDGSWIFCRWKRAHMIQTEIGSVPCV